MVAPEGYEAQATALAEGGYPRIAAKLIGRGWRAEGRGWESKADDFGVGLRSLSPSTHYPRPSTQVQAFFTSATNPVSDFFASPNNIAVFGL
jgi:hypothetical protein